MTVQKPRNRSTGITLNSLIPASLSQRVSWLLLFFVSLRSVLEAPISPVGLHSESDSDYRNDHNMLLKRKLLKYFWGRRLSPGSQQFKTEAEVQASPYFSSRFSLLTCNWGRAANLSCLFHIKSGSAMVCLIQPLSCKKILKKQIELSCISLRTTFTSQYRLINETFFYKMYSLSEHILKLAVTQKLKYWRDHGHFVQKTYQNLPS